MSGQDLQSPSLLQELWLFMRVRKRYWLAPIIIAMALLGLLVIAAGKASVVAPFIYAM